jgi:hypothetical protein
VGNSHPFLIIIIMTTSSTVNRNGEGIKSFCQICKREKNIFLAQFKKFKNLSISLPLDVNNGPGGWNMESGSSLLVFFLIFPLSTFLFVVYRGLWTLTVLFIIIYLRVAFLCEI